MTSNGLTFPKDIFALRPQLLEHKLQAFECPPNTCLWFSEVSGSLTIVYANSMIWGGNSGTMQYLTSGRAGDNLQSHMHLVSTVLLIPLALQSSKLREAFMAVGTLILLAARRCCVCDSARTAGSSCLLSADPALSTLATADSSLHPF